MKKIFFDTQRPALDDEQMRDIFRRTLIAEIQKIPEIQKKMDFDHDYATIFFKTSYRCGAEQGRSFLRESAMSPVSPKLRIAMETILLSLFNYSGAYQKTHTGVTDQHGNLHQAVMYRFDESKLRQLLHAEQRKEQRSHPCSARALQKTSRLFQYQDSPSPKADGLRFVQEQVNNNNNNNHEQPTLILEQPHPEQESLGRDELFFRIIVVLLKRMDQKIPGHCPDIHLLTPVKSGGNAAPFLAILKACFSPPTADELNLDFTETLEYLKEKVLALRLVDSKAEEVRSSPSSRSKNDLLKVKEAMDGVFLVSTKWAIEVSICLTNIQNKTSCDLHNALVSFTEMTDEMRYDMYVKVAMTEDLKPYSMLSLSEGIDYLEKKVVELEKNLSHMNDKPVEHNESQKRDIKMG